MTGRKNTGREQWKTVDVPDGTPRIPGLPASAPYGVCPHDGTPLVFQVPATREGGVTPVMFSTRTRTLCTTCGYDEIEYREGTE
jgi:hypothetical protein